LDWLTPPLAIIAAAKLPANKVIIVIALAVQVGTCAW
jgi:hypothetical protein